MTTPETDLCVQVYSYGVPATPCTIAHALACLSGHLCGDEPAHERFLRTGYAVGPHASYRVMDGSEAQRRLEDARLRPSEVKTNDE